jgi:Uma2 family endonuclease
MATKLAEPQARRWTKSEYDGLAQQGLFQDQRVQLIHGEIIQMPAHGHAHFQMLNRVGELLRGAFGPGYWVRMQGPLDLPLDSVPEPDVAVVKGTLEEYRAHPTTALLAVEISDSTLRLDRRKASLYAASGIADYWLVNMGQSQLEVYRDPVPDATEEFEYRYSEPITLKPSDVIVPVALPRVTIRVEDIFK